MSKQFTVVDTQVAVGERCPVLGKFDTEELASAFIETLPDFEGGRYGLDEPSPVSYKPEVVADSTGKFYGNGLRFATYEEAFASARDLAGRWLLVTDYRAVESEDPVNYKLVDGQLTRIADGVAPNAPG